MENQEASVTTNERPRTASSSRDFDLDKSRWYSLMKLGLACRNAKVCAEIIRDRSEVLARYDYEAAAGKEIAESEMALRDALQILETARAEYEQRAKQVA